MLPISSSYAAAIVFTNTRSSAASTRARTLPLPAEMYGVSSEIDFFVVQTWQCSIPDFCTLPRAANHAELAVVVAQALLPGSSFGSLAFLSIIGDDFQPISMLAPSLTVQRHAALGMHGISGCLLTKPDNMRFPVTENEKGPVNAAARLRVDTQCYFPWNQNVRITLSRSHPSGKLKTKR
ncbi:hypothetical protein CIHG_03807 [Coccidioides immitis H538.4]|uniref:Uncharacterized protein n=2 Tax=Coccidioides immitis TaxID=5501 RepID=A0A0J8RMD3_COCIT|nr:hypothetical protein CIRG_04988 [Coccidioides immitis RMSCC 2394]KMU85766.1 hypothetical protein CIHG_03807 [Coccidioides immitis H538.4]